MFYILNSIIEETAYLGRPAKVGSTFIEHLLTPPQDRSMLDFGVDTPFPGRTPFVQTPAAEHVQSISTTSAVQPRLALSAELRREIVALDILRSPALDTRLRAPGRHSFLEYNPPEPFLPQERYEMPAQRRIPGRHFFVEYNLRRPLLPEEWYEMPAPIII